MRADIENGLAVWPDVILAEPEANACRLMGRLVWLEERGGVVVWVLENGARACRLMG